VTLFMNLPPEWELRESKDYPGRVYYYNTFTNESTWIRPIPYPGYCDCWPPFVYVYHVLIKHTNSYNPTSWKRSAVVRSKDDAFLKITRISKAIIDKSETFEDIAAAESECDSHSSNGKLGWIKKGKMPPEFDEVAWRLNIGEISRPFETKEGFHLVLRRG